MHFVDNTLLSAFAACQTKGYLRHIKNVAGSEESAALKLGEAIHAGLESHLLGSPAGMSFRIFERLYRPFAEIQFPDEDNARCWTNASQLFSAWLTLHPLDTLPYAPVEINEQILVEQAVAAPLTSTITMVGKLDALVRDKETGLLYVLDHKTGGGWEPSSYDRQFLLGSQISGYLWLMSRWLETQGVTEPIAGAFINYIPIKAIPASTTKCKLHGVAYKECGVQHVQGSLLGPFTRTEQQLQDWQQEAERLALAYVAMRDSKQVEAIGMEGVFNGSCRFCEFFDFCRMGRPWADVDSLYEVNKWAPWDSLAAIQ